MVIFLLFHVQYCTKDRHQNKPVDHEVGTSKFKEPCLETRNSLKYRLAFCDLSSTIAVGYSHLLLDVMSTSCICND